MSNSLEIKHPRVGVGVLVMKGNLTLLGKRKNAHGANEWSSIGGHLEYGESIEACAIRELAEETGLKALSLRLGSWTENMLDNRHYITIFAIVDEFEGTPELLEPEKCEGWHWFPIDSLPSPMFASVTSIIQKMGLEYILNPNLRKRNEAKDLHLSCR